MRTEELADIPPCIPRRCLLNWLYGEWPERYHVRQPVGWIIENQGRVAGFEICDVVLRDTMAPAPELLRPLTKLVPTFWRRSKRKPVRIELLEVIVAIPRPRADAVEQLLLGQLLQGLQCTWSGVPVVVPETNLPAQLLLREAGYRAIRIERDYYGGEDGYLMASDQSPLASAALPDFQRTLPTSRDEWNGR